MRPSHAPAVAGGLLWWWLACGLATALACAAGVARADDDTQLRLQQSIDLKALDRQPLPPVSPPTEALPGLVIDGQTIDIRRNAEDVGTALYLSVMHKQWQAALFYLSVYRGLPDHDPSLALFAEGGLLRAQGRLEEAEQAFAAAAALQPGNQITRLELARVQFENHKSGDAQRLFRSIWEHLEAYKSERAAASIQRSVGEYLTALEQRQAWHGSLSIGAVRDSNINQGSERSECQYYLGGTGVCLWQAAGEREIAASGLDYEGTLSKYHALGGHHGLIFRSFAYGRSYRGQTEFDELTWNTSAGYAYRSARDQWSLALLYELSRLGNRSEYNSWGVRGEWMHILAPSLAVRLEGDYKDMRHARYAQADTRQGTAYATLFKTLPGDWTLFGGLDALDRLSVERYMNSYRQAGVRLGLAKEFGGYLEATLFSSFRQRRYDRYNPVFGERRRDREQNHTLILRVPGLAFEGITPALSLRYNKVHSNIDWLYSYDRSSISLKLEKQF